MITFTYNNLKRTNNKTLLWLHLYVTDRVTDYLGSGQFGTVNKGVWTTPTGSVPVAIKTLNDNTSEDERVKFLQEAAIMGQFHHPNVVKLHGVVTIGDPVSIQLVITHKTVNVQAYFTYSHCMPN